MGNGYEFVKTLQVPYSLSVKCVDDKWVPLRDREVPLSRLLDECWGYEFAMEPMAGLDMYITRKFKRIGHLKPAISPDPDDVKHPGVWLWRPIVTPELQKLAQAKAGIRKKTEERRP